MAQQVLLPNWVYPAGQRSSCVLLVKGLDPLGCRFGHSNIVAGTDVVCPDFGEVGFCILWLWSSGRKPWHERAIRFFGFPRGMTVAGRPQLGLPAQSRTPMWRLAKRVKPNPIRLMRLIKLFAASVGPFETPARDTR